MCGINGILSLNGSPVATGDVIAMRDKMVHRGPDGAGHWVSRDGRIGLGHRRLSIIDLSDLAAQPMANRSGSVQIVFNGEVYNHMELKRELIQSGCDHWQTDHSDTEVILQAYEAWGIDCIKRFRGMFAFALWDERSKMLWLVRDRVGIKPLYYTFANGRLAFASEIKAILALPEVRRSVNEEALYHYLSFLTAPAPMTLFDGIFKLPPATRMCINAEGRVSQERYWDVGDNVESLRGVSEAEIAERIIAELRTSVSYRKVSDVPVGIFLSGGIDSSTNTALFSENGDKVRTFSIGYEGSYPKYPSELGHAAKMAKLVGAEHHALKLTVDDLFSFLPAMIYHQDEPIGDVVCVPLYYVARLARDNGVIVCQVGEGADELFCGYPSWKKHLQIARWNRVPIPLVKRLLMGGLAATGHGESFQYEALRRAVSGEPLFWGGAEGLNQTEKHRVLGSDMRAKFSGLSSAEALAPIRRRFLSSSLEQTDLNWMTYLDLNLRLPELLLMRVDKMTMATSLEGRVPFLDHKFVELAMSIPTSAKVQGGELKHILKKAVQGIIPNEVIHRRKQGFGVPLHDWLFDRLGDRIRHEVVRFAERTEVFDPSRVNTYVKSAQGSKVWQLFNLALWHRCFIEGDSEMAYEKPGPSSFSAVA